MTQDNKIFAIGDIHGCYEKLIDLMIRLPYVPGKDRLVFLGDYINRGKGAAQVIELICRLRRENGKVITLLGNHEYILREYLRSHDPQLLPYLRNMGIEATRESYRAETKLHLDGSGYLATEHLEFLDTLLPYWQNDRYIFVHAGIDPEVPLAENDLTTLCEAREIFFAGEHDFGKKVIFGHTPFELPLVTPTRIGIDTGASYGNLLTAVELPAETFYHA